MKTAISLPDETFDEVTRKAAALGVSRSQFFAEAAKRYLRELEGQELTEQINASLEMVPEDDHDAEFTREAARRLVAGLGEDEW